MFHRDVAPIYSGEKYNTNRRSRSRANGLRKGKGENMKQSLLERCEAQIRNEAFLRKADRFEFDQIVKFGALLFTSEGREADSKRAKACKHILEDRAADFSKYRATLQYALMAKMALSDDPVAFLDDVLDAHDDLKAGCTSQSEMLVLAAAIIAEHCPAEKRAMAIKKTCKARARVREQYGFLTDDSIVPFVALMILSGKDVDQAASEAEDLFKALKENDDLDVDTSRLASLTLSFSDKPADQKVKAFFDLYDACKEARVATFYDKLMAIYATFADAECGIAELTARISEVDGWLKKKKGYGMMGVGGYTRRLFAASLVLEDIHSDGAIATALSADGAIARTAVEKLSLILMAIILVCAIKSADVSR